MNGAHDMGGQQDLGPVEYEKDEPVFHAQWEARIYALTRAMRAWRKWTLDADRHALEVLLLEERERLLELHRRLERRVRLLGDLAERDLPGVASRGDDLADQRLARDDAAQATVVADEHGAHLVARERLPRLLRRARGVECERIGHHRVADELRLRLGRHG